MDACAVAGVIATMLAIGLTRSRGLHGVTSAAAAVFRSITRRRPVRSLGTGTGHTGAGTSVLRRARSLRAPVPKKLKGGEMEDAGFWMEHEELLQRAWAEFGRGDESVYHLGSSSLHPAIAAGDPAALRAEAHEVIPGVLTFPLLSQSFCEALLRELDRLQASGIPMRRPNGMNRHGAIVSDLGFSTLLRQLNELVMPLACEAFPTWIGPSDCEEQYGESSAAAEHALRA